jgi:hypothetical protein
MRMSTKLIWMWPIDEDVLVMTYEKPLRISLMLCYDLALAEEHATKSSSCNELVR